MSVIRVLVCSIKVFIIFSLNMFNAQGHRESVIARRLVIDILKIKDEGVIPKRTTVSKQRENSDAV